MFGKLRLMIIFVFAYSIYLTRNWIVHSYEDGNTTEFTDTTTIDDSKIVNGESLNNIGTDLHTNKNIEDNNSKKNIKNVKRITNKQKVRKGNCCEIVDVFLLKPQTIKMGKAEEHSSLVVFIVLFVLVGMVLHSVHETMVITKQEEELKKKQPFERRQSLSEFANMKNYRRQSNKSRKLPEEKQRDSAGWYDRVQGCRIMDFMPHAYEIINDMKISSAEDSELESTSKKSVLNKTGALLSRCSSQEIQNLQIFFGRLPTIDSDDESPDSGNKRVRFIRRF